MDCKIKAMLMLDGEDMCSSGASMIWQVEVQPEEAVDFATKADDPMLLQVIEKVNELMPRMDYGGDNPNNGRMAHRFLIGREYSRVVYVYMPTAYLKDPSTETSLRSDIEAIGFNASADEVHDQTQPGAIKVRIWWD